MLAIIAASLDKNTDNCCVVLIIYCPPPAQQLLVYIGLLVLQGFSSLCPWLFFPDEVHQFDIVLEMSIRWLVLITPARCAVVGEAQAMPGVVRVVFVQ